LTLSPTPQDALGYYIVTTEDTSRDTLLKLTVPEAASRLGVTQSAIRKRVQRKQISFDKDERGHTHVYLGPDECDRDGEAFGPVTDEPVTRQEPHLSRNGYTEALEARVGSLEKQVAFLQEELAARRVESTRKESIIAGLVQRIPAIEPPQEPSERPQNVSEGGDGTEGPADDTGQPRASSWWRRFFIGD
jgi:hypothetical protein